MKNICLFFCLFAFAIGGLQAQCPAPCVATVSYVTNDGAFLDWCETPGVDSFSVTVTSVATGATYGPFVVGTSQILLTGIVATPGDNVFNFEVCSNCPGNRSNAAQISCTSGNFCIIIVDEVVTLEAPSGGTTETYENTSDTTQTIPVPITNTSGCKRGKITVKKTSIPKSATFLMKICPSGCSIKRTTNFLSSNGLYIGPYSLSSTGGTINISTPTSTSTGEPVSITFDSILLPSGNTKISLRLPSGFKVTMKWDN